MTVIAAYNGTSSFVFGADTGVDYGDCRMTTCEDKVRKEHNWIINQCSEEAKKSLGFLKLKYPQRKK